MTLILAHDRFMACDSIQLGDGLNLPPYPGFRKIVRVPDGSLFGSGGNRLNSDALRNWALAGMDFNKPPKLLRKDDDSNGYYWIWMHTDGHVFLGDYDLMYHRVGPSDMLGEGNACVYAHGVIEALQHPSNPPRGARALVRTTMHIVTERCVFTKPPVYVFDLDHPELDP